MLRRLAADVVFYHLYASALAVRLATIGRRRPSRVHMVAGPLYLDSPTIRRVERFLARLDHAVIGGSEHTAERYRQLGLPADRVHAIPYGIDARAFAPSEPREVESARESLDVRPSTVVFVMVAYVYSPKPGLHGGVGIKGHHTLIDAWRELAVQAPDAELIVVGGGFDETAEQYRQELLADFASLPGARWIATVDDVRPFYAAADVSVAPSLSENHGSALEASLSSVPCIVSDAGALPETVDADIGWIFEAGDSQALAACMLEAVSDGREALARRGERARRVNASRFDSHDAAVRVADVIEAVESVRR